MNDKEVKLPVLYKTTDLLQCGKFSKREADFLQVLLVEDAYTLAQVKALIETEMERVID